MPNAVVSDPKPTKPNPQQWMGNAYIPRAAAAMVMPRQMMSPPPFAPLPHYYGYHQYAQMQKGLGCNDRMMRVSGNGNGNESNKTVWIGDLLQWMDENYLHSCFSSSGEVLSIKVIRNKHTGLSEGYGFVEFQSHAAAEKVIQGYLGALMPNTDQPFHLNWASISIGDKRSDNAPDLSIFVGDLAADVNDTILLEIFFNKYPSVKGAKVVIDTNTGRSKGYGFVRFGEESERSQAMTEMNGTYCSSRPMRIGVATPRKSPGNQGPNGTSAQLEGDSTNTTIFVGGLDPSVTDDDLKQHFSECGEVVSIKIPNGKGCGFVQFSERKNAEDALQKLNGTLIGKQTVRLSWGRSPANRQSRSEFGFKHWNGCYYGSPMYDGYGYPPHIFPAPYGPYPIYNGHHQKQQVS